MLRILSIGLEPVLLAERNRVLVEQGFVVRGAATRTDVVRIANSEPFDVVLIYDQIPQGYAEDLTNQLRYCLGDAPIIFVPAQMDEASIQVLERLRDHNSRTPQAA